MLSHNVSGAVPVWQLASGAEKFLWRRRNVASLGCVWNGFSRYKSTVSRGNRSLSTPRFGQLGSERSPLFSNSERDVAGVRSQVCRKIHTTPIPPQLFLQPETIITALPNGLRVASVKSNSEIATVGVFIDSGSRYETKETNGVAHFLEHMVFKGTRNRSRVELERQIEDMGAHLNAYTAREQTVYYAKVFNQDVPQAVDILADILTNSLFERDAIEEERHVVLREMEEVEKCPEEVIFDRLHMTTYRDSPLGLTILGPPENIQSLQREDILNYINANYTPDRLVLVAAGAVEHKTLVELAQKHLGHLRRPADPEVVIKTEPPYFCGSQLVQKTSSLGKFCHIAMGYPAVGWSDPAQPVFMVMQSVIGAYNRLQEGLVPGKLSANRTINEVANKEDVGCVESYSAFNTCYKDAGLFGFYIVTNEVAAFHAVQELMFSVCQLAYCVTEEEVQRAKQVLKASIFGSLETTTAVCEDVGRQILVYGRRIPAAEMYRRIDSVNAEEVRRVAWKYLYDTDISLAAIGAAGFIPYFNQLQRYNRLVRW